jgi:hypothetical protein
VELVLQGRNQEARFVRTGEDAFFAGVGPQIASRLVISSDQPIAVLGLRADFGGPFLISGIPVTPLEE